MSISSKSSELSIPKNSFNLLESNDSFFNFSYDNTTITNKYKYCLFYLIRNTLISLDGVIIHNVKVYTNSFYSLYSIINFNHNFNFNNFVNVISSILYNNIKFKIYRCFSNYNIFVFEYNNEIILRLYLFNIHIYNYLFSNVESHFDCNMIITNYFGYNILPNNNTLPITYDDIIYRVNNRRFCYASSDLSILNNYFEDSDYELNISKSIILTKIMYAMKLITFNWFMDEYILKEKSWTINYWKAYKDFYNLVKLNNKKNKITKCYYCKKKFDKNDIVFNIKEIFIHFDCLFTKLYQD